MNTLLSFGHGYSARALAKLLPPQEWRIFGTTRAREKFGELRATDVIPLQFPGDDMSDALDEATHILVSAGPTDDGDPVLAELREQIAARAARFAWVGYLSTTGVYGDHAGGWVDEDSPLAPTTRRGNWRKRAEEDWRSIPDLPLHIFRLAGIYGPGRGPFAKVMTGKARRIIKENQVFSRIHVDDIAQALHASIEKPNPGSVYNLCDDEPAPPQDVISYAAELLGLPPPPEIRFVDADLSPMARSFYAESKRVRNERIKTELGVALQYPGYREGLRALLEQEQT